MEEESSRAESPLAGDAEVHGLKLESEGPEKEPSVGATAEGDRVAQDTDTAENNLPQTTSEEGKDEARTSDDVGVGCPTASDGEREKEGEKEKCKKSGSAEQGKEEEKKKKKKKTTENGENAGEEEGKGKHSETVTVSGAQGGNGDSKAGKKEQTKAGQEGGLGKEKEKSKEPDKQAKTKRKAGVNTQTSSTSAAPSRPRTSGRSGRASAKNDIIAKFQQGAPETPTPRNFKVQRSSAGATATGATIKQKMLQWCRNKTRNYQGINIENFSSSWCDGLAFCALVHRYFPDAFDFSSLKAEERRKNFALAFGTAESLADCYPLLEVDDMILMGDRPDPMCVFTYVQALCQTFSKIDRLKKDKETAEQEKNEKDKEEPGELNEASGAVETGGETGQGRDAPENGMKDTPEPEKEEEASSKSPEGEEEPPTTSAIELNKDDDQKREG
ncbi:hypothetical protein NHX12_010908 [Muraenolepis orangiensis]|uniref:Calponin-homology (CH) domain-containing protein n=1 Tax=Muraenolepis orangiensis TaxID=630683 RepID=A0A9Q0DEU8_9TELE|nr:hypothetical protein NHX12_010908 [Muraenolepis orangiensis]